MAGFIMWMYAVAGILLLIKDCRGFQCYSCSYTRSSDPRLSYECVTEPWNVTTGMTQMSCQAPYMCITKTLFNKEMTHIRSVSRVCQPQQEVCRGERCCNMAGHYPTCEHKCRSDMCNNKSPESWLKQPSTGSDDDGSGGGATGLVGSVVTVFVMSVLSALT